MAEFKGMLEKLVAKDTTITHAEVPAALTEPPPAGKRKPEDEPKVVTPDKDTSQTKKKQKLSNVHLLLRQHIHDNVLRVAKGVSLSKLCKYSNTNVQSQCRDSNRCVLYMLGMCGNPKCSRQHAVATDEEANHN